MMPDRQTLTHASSTTWQLGRELRPYAWHLGALFGISLLATPLALLTPLPVQIAVVNGLVPFFSSAITLVAMTYVTARINWKFAMIGLAILPFVLVVSHFYRRRIRGQYRTVKRVESSALSVVQEVLGSVRVVRAFGQEKREQDRFIKRSNEGLLARLHLEIL